MSSIKLFSYILLIFGIYLLTEVQSQKAVEHSLCSDTDTPTVCKLKKSQCAPINSLFLPPGGIMKTMISCAKSSDVTLAPLFFQSVGQSFVAGKPELLLENLSPDPNATMAIRKCFFNATGLIDDAMTGINRSALMDNLSKQPLPPNLVVPVFNALMTCPEPKDFSLGPFLTCIRKACVDNVILPAMEGPQPSANANPMTNKFGLNGNGFIGASGKGNPFASGAFGYKGPFSPASMAIGSPTGDFTSYIPPQVANLIKTYTMG